MKTLADEIMPLIKAPGLTIKAACAALSADAANVRRAFDALDQTSRAKLARRGKTLHLLPTDDSTLVCAECRAVFTRKPKSTAVTCSRSCAVALSWKNETTKKTRGAAISAALGTPEAKQRLADHNRRRWSKPEEHEKLSEQNRQRWADPVTKARYGVRMQQQNSTPEARAKLSAIKKAQWQDPEYRRKTIEAARAGNLKPETKANHRARMVRRWQDPEQRKKLTEANRRRNAERSRKARERREAAP